MTIRERIAKLVDPGSFEEVGQLTGRFDAADKTQFLPDAYVGGLARIDGRPVAIGGEDFTVRGGSGSENSAKSDLIQRLA
ncbi:MAG: methylmalonyl-CoA carboxyltransferase, partial [Actinobacteria bacterium]